MHVKCPNIFWLIVCLHKLQILRGNLFICNIITSDYFQTCYRYVNEETNAFDLCLRRQMSHPL